MNKDMIEYLANMERRVNSLADQIEDLENIIEETFHREGGARICPHRYEVVQTVKYDTTEICTYVCRLCGKSYKKVYHKSK